MRIVQMVENLARGGLERMALDLAVAQKAAGHDTRIYCLFDRGDLAAEAEAAGVPVTAFHKQPGASPGIVLRLARQLRADRVEVLHTHNPGIHHYAAVASWLARTRALINTRHSPLDSRGRPYQDRYFRWVLPLTAAVVYVCDHTRQALVRSAGLPLENSCVVFNGVRLEPYEGCQAAPGSVLPRVRFGTVGRLVPAKAHDVLLDAFARVAAELPGAELRIGGYGEREAALREQIARLGLESRVTLEPVEAPQVPALLAGLDVFVLSSANEGLPLVILEAMAAGLPIVSTRVGGVPEVAPEGRVSRLRPPGDAAALAQAMLAAARDPELAARGAEARRMAFSSYGLQHMAAQYEAVMERALGRSAR